ncbi:uncharacterized protein LOC134542492 isoform X2 [Bacillus rossius redtenbacheri]|uniref:uncharacterized protein LOC134542492 isoform X2 n=1 Tax=Bacillus rossius redtenbacheri TaxID=93214 RepID=UPI002FDE99EF
MPKKGNTRPRYVCENVRRSSRRPINQRDVLREEPLAMGEWKFEERLRLLHAMKKYGHDDVDKLSAEVPTRTANQIRTYIRSWLKLAQRVCKSKKDNGRLKITKHAKLVGRIPLERDINPNNTSKAPLDQWLELIEENMPASLRERSFLVGKAFKYISLFEIQPRPEDCEGINFRAVYEFMYCMLNGLPYKNMNKETTQYVLDLIKALARHVASSEYKAHMAFLDTVCRVNLGKDNCRCYQGKKMSSKSEAGLRPRRQDNAPLRGAAGRAGLQPAGGARGAPEAGAERRGRPGRDAGGAGRHQDPPGAGEGPAAQGPEDLQQARAVVEGGGPVVRASRVCPPHWRYSRFIS